MIRVTQPQFGPEVEALVLEVLRSGHLAQGPMVARFEELGALMAGAEHAVAVANGTASLETAFEVLDVSAGQEVITTPFTFAATFNAALRSGATIRFADIRDDFTLDPESVRALIGPRTAVVVPVHLFGLMADMPALMEIAEGHGLAVVEDAAQAHGAEIAGRRAGSFGIGSFSFYATKNVAAGEGGLLTTSDPNLARRMRLIRNQGMVERYQYEMVGRNLRMTDLQAAVAIPQLERLDALTTARQHNASRLSEILDGVPGLRLPVVAERRRHVWHQYTVLLSASANRDDVREGLRNLGVEAGVYYPSLPHDLPVYRDHPGVVLDDTPKARDAAARCLSLPVHQFLSEGEVETVGQALRKVLASG